MDNQKTESLIKLGQRFKEALKARNWKPAEIARAVDTSPQTVNNWIKRGVSKDYAIRVAGILGVTVDSISTLSFDGIPVTNGSTPSPSAQDSPFKALAKSQQYAVIISLLPLLDRSELTCLQRAILDLIEAQPRL